MPPVVLIESLGLLPIADFNCRFEELASAGYSQIGNRQLTIDNVLAGAGGFEPTNAGSKDRCLTTWLRPSADGLAILAT
jgi:hypothetical protein